MFKALYNASENGHWVFLLCTVILGGWAAYVSGRAIAETWRPFWQVITYALLLALVVRFMQFALFEEVLLSLRSYLVDSAVLIAATILGYVTARRQQMAVTYEWLK